MDRVDYVPRTVWRTRLAVAIAASCLVVSGCAQYQELQAIPPGKQVNLVTIAPDIKPPEADSKGELAAKGAAVGAGAGMVVGAGAGLMGSIACGPLIFICAPAGLIVGAGAGLIVGGVYGTAAGAIAGLPAEKADKLNDYYVEHIGELDLRAELQRAFLNNGGTQWGSGGAGATTDITLSLDTLYVAQSNGEELMLVVGVGMVVSDGSGKADRTKTYRYQVNSAQQHVDWWLADEGANIRKAFDESMNRIGDQVVRTLEAGL